MAMNWPQFEVPLLFVHFDLPLKMHVQKLSGHIANSLDSFYVYLFLSKTTKYLKNVNKNTTYLRCQEIKYIRNILGFEIFLNVVIV